MSGLSNQARRSHTRALLMQAHYQQQLDGTSRAELARQFAERREYERVDPEYFDTLLTQSLADTVALDAEIVSLADRSAEQLNPVEIAILRVALTELRERIDIPYRVVINEAVALAHRFAAEAAHKYINAVLDRAARTHRAVEVKGRERA
ncbi:MAG: transcription antitermination factor NusB [Pseudomonadota bacterium]